MTTYLTRDGVAHNGPVAENEKGQPYFTRARPCRRCGGAGGSDKWKHTGWTCFDCGGSGAGGSETVRLYTAEQLANLDAAQNKRNARKQAAAEAAAELRRAEAAARAQAFETRHGALLAAAERYLERSEFLRDVVTKARERNDLTEAQSEAIRKVVAKIQASDAAKASSQYVGAPGERISASVTVERSTSFERPKFGADWKSETVWVTTMRTADGNALVAKTPTFCPEVGALLAIKATVKEHTEYRGEQQTVVQRVTIAR